MFLNDTGLAASLLGLNEARLATETSLRGALLENFLAMELRKQLGWSGARARLFHFRTAAGQEVDFVLEEMGGGIVGIKVKTSTTVTGQDFNAVRMLADAAGPRFRCGIVLHTGKAAVPFGRELYALPLSTLWRSE